MDAHVRTDYTLSCLCTGKILEDDNLPLCNDECSQPAFLRTEYKRKKLALKDDSFGLYKFADWLPLRRMLDGSNAPITFKGDDLGTMWGLKNLWITFNGYWPEKGAKMTTGTFKETEAYSVCARLPVDFDGTLVVASAGNTARAFSKVCSRNKIPLVVIVPEKNRSAMWFDEKIDPCVTFIAAGGESDYFDAIRLAGLICNIKGFVPEGGARNIARRDGMATTVLSAVTTIGKIPEYYFQAVGSGTGAIAAWEANLRLIEDGSYGNNKMHLYVSQNAPFLLIHDSWRQKSRDLMNLDENLARSQIETIWAKVLSNRKPPYGIIGGLYDALVDSHGDVFAVENLHAKEAAELFHQVYNIDLSPAAGVALASLKQAVETNRIDPDALVMLNVTGGGIERFKTERNPYTLEPHFIIDRDDIDQEKVDALAEEYGNFRARVPA